jgi:hypothetical protein
MNELLQTMFKNIIWRLIQVSVFDVVRPKICHTSIFQIKGKTKSLNHDLSTLVFAKEEIVHYFSTLSYSDEPDIKYLGKVTFHSIQSIIENAKPDIVLVDANKIFTDFLLSNGFFILPHIDFVLDISDSWDLIYGKMDRDKRRVIRKIQKLDYTYEVTANFKKFKFFYYNMYLPHITKRYGKSANIVSFVEFERLFRKGGLLLAKLNGEYVSGAIFVIHGKTVYIPILSVKEVDKYLAKGASHAALYFLILWAKQHGYKWVDYGSCSPFLKDGLFLYKKSWGMQIRPIEGLDAKIFAIKFCNFKKAVREFILKNPFIFIDSSKLKGLVMLNSTPEDLHRIYIVSGLSGLIVLCPPNKNYSGLQRLHLETVKFPPPLGFLMNMIAKEGYHLYSLNF